MKHVTTSSQYRQTIGTELLVGAREAARRGNRRNALVLLASAAEFSPDNPEIHVLLGQAYHELKQDERAIQSLLTAIRLKPDYAQAYYHLGRVYQEAQQWEQAAVCYRATVVLQPNHVEAYCRLGAVAMDLNCHAQSIEPLERALELDPSLWEAQYNLASAYLRLHDHAHALDACRRLTELNPEDADARRMWVVASDRCRPRPQPGGPDGSQDHCLTNQYGCEGPHDAPVRPDEEIGDEWGDSLGRLAR